MAAAKAGKHQDVSAISGRQGQPRRTAGKHLVQQGAVVNYFAAHKLLDEVRDGHNHTYADITTALELVGDIDPDVCTDGTSWWRPSAETGQTGLPGATVCRTGTGFSRDNGNHSHEN